MSPRVAIALLAILVGACVLREGSARLSVVTDPIRSDAREYPPRPTDLPPILYAQAALGTLTVLVAFLLARRILPTGFSLAAAALTAASPHLVGMGLYVLSETLLAFLVTLALYVFCGLARGPSGWRAALAGALLASAALTHLQILYFALPLALFLLLRVRDRAGALRTTAALAAGFAALYGAWPLRNALTQGVSGDDTLVLRTLRIGVYRDFRYQDRPETYGYPYRYDPGFEASSATLGGVLREIANAFAEAPAAELGWYLRKPWVAWTWEPVQGFGDVFIYPVSRTPYADRSFFRATHSAMHVLHAPLVALMWVGVVLAWLPRRSWPQGDDARFGAQAVALLVLYHAATMTLGFPLPRYSVPLRPCLYVLAMLPLAAGWHRLDAAQRLRERRLASRVRPAASSHPLPGSGTTRSTR